MQLGAEGLHNLREPADQHVTALLEPRHVRLGNLESSSDFILGQVHVVARPPEVHGQEKGCGLLPNFTPTSSTTPGGATRTRVGRALVPDFVRAEW